MTVFPKKQKNYAFRVPIILKIEKQLLKENGFV